MTNKLTPTEKAVLTREAIEIWLTAEEINRYGNLGEAVLILKNAFGEMVKLLPKNDQKDVKDYLVNCGA